MTADHTEDCRSESAVERPQEVAYDVAPELLE